ncbi:MAG: DUF1844 domain-containing protein [Thermodesulfobacteriota bacterium]
MEESDRDEGFKVKDRRRFSETGEARPEPEGAAETKEAQEAPKAQEKEEAVKERAGEAEDREAPPLTFIAFVITLANATLVHLGLVRNPDTGEANKDLSAARQTIDLIALLQEKTRGNLTPEEKQVIEETLYQLRMAFVEAAKS